jgi:hypothetical protein
MVARDVTQISIEAVSVIKRYFLLQTEHTHRVCGNPLRDKIITSYIIRPDQGSNF